MKKYRKPEREKPGFRLISLSGGEPTERLAPNFSTVVTAALNAELGRGNTGLADALEQLLGAVNDVSEVLPSLSGIGSNEGSASTSNDGWTRVIAPGGTAIITTTSGTQEVAVLGYFHTPAGLQYRLEHPTPTVRWMVQAGVIEPINGVTETVQFNVMTGEVRAAS
jgi:hypothetical protein